MTREELIAQIVAKRSFLCVGLDTDVRKLPPHIMDEENPMLSFNRAIIDATEPSAVAFKPNVAFYESMGSYGMKVLEETIDYIKDKYPHMLVIADGKRGDIGNTGALYARAYFEHFHADGITVAPYMGEDSVKPFLAYSDKWVVLLALTSNDGSKDFQMQKNDHGEYFFESVIRTSQEWGDKEHLMYVVGATHPEWLERIRAIAPDHFLLVPGIGAQGGDFDAIVSAGMTKECGLLVNASRSIIYASNGERFAEAAHNEAEAVRLKMERALISKGII